jgi:cytoskeletal protein RodZ
MLSNYAGFLGLDPEPLLLRFAEGLQAGLAARQSARAPATRKPPAARSALPRFLSIDLVVGVSLVVFLVVFVSWSALRISAVRTSQTPTATAPSIADVLAQPGDTPTPQGSLPATPEQPAALLSGTPALQVEPSATAELSATPEPVSVSAATPTVFSVTSGSAVQVNIIARQRAWMRVLVDGEIAYEGRVLPGGVYVFAGSDQVQVRTGNGAALQVFFNQQDLGLLGLLGEVVDRIFTVKGMLTPTPSPTPFGQTQVAPTLPAGLVFPTPGQP